MLILLFLILIILLCFKYSFARYFTSFILIFLAIFGQFTLIVGNNMTPNLNIADTVLCIRPNCIIGGKKFGDLSKIPLIGQAFTYSYGDVVIVNTKIEKEDEIIIQPKIIRVVGKQGDTVELKPQSWKLNNKVVSCDKYGAYYYEKNNNKSYLILPGRRKNISENMNKFVIPEKHVLCMYDNRYNPEQGVSEILIEEKDIYCVPIINLTNIVHYHEMFIK